MRINQAWTGWIAVVVQQTLSGADPFRPSQNADANPIAHGAEDWTECRLTDSLAAEAGVVR